MKATRPRAIKVKKSWTHDQAWAADERFRNSGGDGPAGPFYQWVALNELDEMKVSYEGGNSYVLMQAIRVCANHDLVMPEWVRLGYIKAFDKVNSYRAKSWDEVFGKPLTKGANLNALRKKREMSIQVWNEIQRRIRSNPVLEKSTNTRKRGALIAIDDELFESVGKQFNLGLTLTKEYYASWKKRWGSAASKPKKSTPRTLKK